MAAVPQVLWANNSAGHVQSGGTDVPAQGTSETITVDAATAAAFPAAALTASPATVFYFADLYNPGETYMCTNVSGTGNTTWTVTRGADGTQPVAHSAPFPIRGTTPAGVLNSFQALLTNGMQPYYSTTALPLTGLAVNTFSTTVALTPPSGYRFWAPLHIWAGSSGIGGETITLLGTGTLQDGTSNGGAVTFTSTGGGGMDPANLLAGTVGTSNNNSGQQIWWAGNPATDKRLKSYGLQVKFQNTASSTAVITVAWWAIPIL